MPTRKLIAAIAAYLLAAACTRQAPSQAAGNDAVLEPDTLRCLLGPEVERAMLIAFPQG